MQQSSGGLAGDGGFAGIGSEGDDISGEREGGLKLWEGKYRFQKEMLPAFVGEAFGRKVSGLFPVAIEIGLTVPGVSQIFSTGKSLNFIRYSCHDSEWVVTREKLSNTGGSKWRFLTICHLLTLS